MSWGMARHKGIRVKRPLFALETYGCATMICPMYWGKGLNMHKSLLMPMVLGLALVTASCRDPNYIPDPVVDYCNQGGVLNARQRMMATEPKPQAVPGRPFNCQMGPDGIMRPAPPATP